MINLLRWCVRIGGLAALILGILLWRGLFIGGVNLHIGLGLLVAAALAILALRAAAASIRMPMAIAGVVWAAATVYVGLMQTHWLPGGSHWIVDVLHLLLGIGAIGMAEAIGGAMARRG